MKTVTQVRSHPLSAAMHLWSMSIINQRLIISCNCDKYETESLASHLHLIRKKPNNSEWYPLFWSSLVRNSPVFVVCLLVGPCFWGTTYSCRSRSMLENVFVWRMKRALNLLSNQVFLAHEESHTADVNSCLQITFPLTESFILSFDKSLIAIKSIWNTASLVIILDITKRWGWFRPLINLLVN